MLERLGIGRYFEDVFDIIAAELEPKPARQTHQRFLRQHDVDPARAAMFEDLARNLVAPHEFGMTTVLVVPDGATRRRGLGSKVADAARARPRHRRPRWLDGDRRSLIPPIDEFVMAGAVRRTASLRSAYDPAIRRIPHVSTSSLRAKRSNPSFEYEAGMGWIASSLALLAMTKMAPGHGDPDIACLIEIQKDGVIGPTIDASARFPKES